MGIMQTLIEHYQKTRRKTVQLCKPLNIEDYVVQPFEEVSPPKWHLGHTSWFFETFILQKFAPEYKLFHKNYSFLFNSYYDNVGDRVMRTARGNLSRPTVSEVYRYRNHVDSAMEQFLDSDQELDPEIQYLVELGIHHEQQHQELLITDIKYILGNNPLFPAYDSFPEHKTTSQPDEYMKIESGMYEVGFTGDAFCFDNELKRHSVYLADFEIRNNLVRNKEYLDFINDGGYENVNLWHSEGWSWITENNIRSPLFWHKINGDWMIYTLEGIKPVTPGHSLMHVSYYEAYAFAEWKGLRLPTEFEWEIAAGHFDWGERWEWTNSAYLAYPGFQKAEGAVGEYNGKFMVNQKVLRGGSVATPEGHSRISYRNFFHPHLRWQYTGIRLAK